MNQHHYDYALVGHNYISYMMSIPLIKRGKKIIVLDDDYFNYGEMFTNSLVYLDLQFLNQYGQNQDIPLFNQINNFSEIKAHHFFIGRKSVYLGVSPFDSYRELCRKFPYFFKQHNIEREKFNSLYFESCEKLASFTFNSKKSQISYNDFFVKSIGSEINDLFQSFFQNFLNKQAFDLEGRHEFHSFIFLMRSFLQNRLAISGTKAEIYHLFLSMLSPFYVLKHEKLVHELKHLHQNFGGTYRDLNLANLKLDRNKLNGIELFNFEGLLRPQNVVFFGGNPKVEKLRLKNADKPAYQMIKGRIDLTKLPDYLKNFKLVFTSSLKIGTDHPLFEVSFETSSLRFNILSFRRHGEKLDFFKDDLIKTFHSDLSYLFPEVEFVFSNCELDFTQDIFLEDKNFKAHFKKDAPWSANITHFFHQDSPLVFKKLKNVYYFGPFNNESLGLFSSLVELKKWQEKIT